MNITAVKKINIKRGSTQYGDWFMHIVEVNGEEMPLFAQNDDEPKVGDVVETKVKDGKTSASYPKVSEAETKTQKDIATNEQLDRIEAKLDAVGRMAKAVYKEVVVKGADIDMSEFEDVDGSSE